MRERALHMVHSLERGRPLARRPATDSIAASWRSAGAAPGRRRSAARVSQSRQRQARLPPPPRERRSAAPRAPAGRRGKIAPRRAVHSSASHHWTKPASGPPGARPPQSINQQFRTQTRYLHTAPRARAPACTRNTHSPKTCNEAQSSAVCSRQSAHKKGRAHHTAATQRAGLCTPWWCWPALTGLAACCLQGLAAAR